MTPERWQQIKSILIDALESGSAEEEAATIDRACDHDASLRTEVEALLHQAPRVSGDLQPGRRHNCKIAPPPTLEELLG